MNLVLVAHRTLLEWWHLVTHDVSPLKTVSLVTPDMVSCHLTLGHPHSGVKSLVTLGPSLPRAGVPRLAASPERSPVPPTTCPIQQASPRQPGLSLPPEQQPAGPVLVPQEALSREEGSALITCPGKKPQFNLE